MEGTQRHHVEPAAGEGQVLDPGQVQQLVAGGPPLVLLHVHEDQRGDAEAGPGGVDDGREAGDHAIGPQPVQPGVRCGPGHADPVRQLVDREPAIVHQRGDDAAVDVVELSVFRHCVVDQT